MKSYPVHCIAIIALAGIELLAIEHGMDGVVLKSTIGGICGIAASIPVTAFYYTIKTKIQKRRESKDVAKTIN